MEELAPIKTSPPSGAAAQLQWLVDRAEINDLLVEFARALDARDWAAYVATFTEDGVLERPGAFRFVGHAELFEGAEQGLGQLAGTWHMSANHAISIDGDRARTRSYSFGVVLSEPGNASVHLDAGGWYDRELRRTENGWRFAHVQLNEVWTSERARS